ncbi:hypothetical protein QG37_06309 [Candidozyma auris]|nr:hypothetical protein QG37_06309 [[Candida] auris]
MSGAFFCVTGFAPRIRTMPKGQSGNPRSPTRSEAEKKPVKVAEIFKDSTETQRV